MTPFASDGKCYRAYLMTDPLPPGLYVVATPIGNLGDLSPRAADTLRRAAEILAEDTRVTGKLLAHIGAKTRMRRFDDHASERDRDSIVARLGSEAIALVSDAGTPLISDPGYELVRAAREAGHDIYTVPGPSAAIAALTLAGLPTDRFLFVGFLPAKAKARADAIADVAAIRATLVVYESGPRLATRWPSFRGSWANAMRPSRASSPSCTKNASPERSGSSPNATQMLPRKARSWSSLGRRRKRRRRQTPNSTQRCRKPWPRPLPRERQRRWRKHSVSPASALTLGRWSSHANDPP